MVEATILTGTTGTTNVLLMIGMIFVNGISGRPVFGTYQRSQRNTHAGQKINNGSRTIRFSGSEVPSLTRMMDTKAIAGQSRISPGDTIASSVLKMSQNSFGISDHRALHAAGSICRVVADVFPQQARELGDDYLKLTQLKTLDDLQLYHADLSRFYQNVCLENPKIAVVLLSAVQSGILSREELWEAINSQDKRLNAGSLFQQLQKEIPDISPDALTSNWD